MIILDGRTMTSRNDAHDALARALCFPEYYGKNLDALWDLATTLRAELTITHASAMQAALGTYGTKLLNTLREAAMENPEFSVTIED